MTWQRRWIRRSAPITRASGKKHYVGRRFVKNNRLNHAGYLWAFAALRACQGADAQYRRRRDHGDWHAQALRLARGFTAAHPDGAVTYTAHELRHVSASLLITSDASDMQICNQMGHSGVETTKNIYGHLFDQDRTSLLEALNSAGTRLYITDEDESGEGAMGAA